MNYKNLNERRAGSEFDIEMIEDVESYIMNNYKLKGNADNAVQGIMNSTSGDMDNLEMYYNRGGAKAGAEYVMDNLPQAAIRKYLNESRHVPSYIKFVNENLRK